MTASPADHTPDKGHLARTLFPFQLFAVPLVIFLTLNLVAQELHYQNYSTWRLNWLSIAQILLSIAIFLSLSAIVAWVFKKRKISWYLHAVALPFAMIAQPPWGLVFLPAIILALQSKGLEKINAAKQQSKKSLAESYYLFQLYTAPLVIGIATFSLVIASVLTTMDSGIESPYTTAIILMLLACLVTFMAIIFLGLKNTKAALQTHIAGLLLLSLTWLPFSLIFLFPIVTAVATSPQKNTR